jgi:SAM-dependent methyltransferase
MKSEFYGLEAFKAGKSSLNSIELNLLNDVKGKSILHLQCHFGQDSLSLARMGAEVVGVDFSDEAIAQARNLSKELNIKAEFICCDIYELPKHIDQKFDIVFTSYGTYGWLPDLSKWASVIKHFLRPGGVFVMADFHPVVWMFDDNFEKLVYSYFKSEPIIEQSSGTYADKNAKLNITSVGWNHGMSEIITPLLNQGMILKSFHEFDYSPYDCFQNMKKVGENCFKFKALACPFPIVFAIKVENPV